MTGQRPRPFPAAKLKSGMQILSPLSGSVVDVLKVRRLANGDVRLLLKGEEGQEADELVLSKHGNVERLVNWFGRYDKR